MTTQLFSVLCFCYLWTMDFGKLSLQSWPMETCVTFLVPGLEIQLSGMQNLRHIHMSHVAFIFS